MPRSVRRDKVRFRALDGCGAVGSNRNTMSETQAPAPPAPNPSCGRLADLVALVHLGFVAFVVWTEALVLLGAVLGWEWTRDPVLRCVHLGLVGYVGIQDVFGKICPLTIWENRLRDRAGQTRSNKSFIGKIVHKLLMCELDERTLRRIRLTFALVVSVTFLIVPPRF